MIVWSGKGFLAALVLVIAFIICAKVLPEDISGYSFAIAFFATAVFSWFFGKKWNEEEGKVFIDKATGEEVHVKPNHSLFWIKLQYWGFIFAALGVVFLVQELRGM